MGYRKTVRVVTILFLGGLLLSAIGCGGGNNSAGTGGGGGPLVTAAQVRMGDAPADRVTVFEVTVGPITLTPTTGSPVTVLSGTRRIELTHNSGSSEPLALLNIPQGTYTGGTITVSNPEVVFISSGGLLVTLEPTFNQAVSVSFSPALTVGAGASVLNIDLNAANSLTFDPVTGDVTGVNITGSSFTLTSSTVAANENEQEPDDGELEDTTGTVASVSGTSFTLNVASTGTQLTFTTDNNTQFNDGASLATMLAGTVVTVEGVTKPDGTLYAKEVEGVENENGSELDGLILPPGIVNNQFSFFADDGSGNGTGATTVGTAFTVDVTGAQFKVSQGNIDTSGIGGLPAPPNFPFDASHVSAGQRVEVESVGSVSVNPLPTEKVKLIQQTLSGTVSGLSGTAPTTFTLSVAADSAFAAMSGFTTVTVHWQAGTDVSNLTQALANNATVRVRGLLFFTGTQFNMIARRITP